MKHLRLWIALGIFGLLAAVGSVASHAQAGGDQGFSGGSNHTTAMAQGCSNATLVGTYLYSFSGSLVDTGGTLTPFTATGLEVFGGNGTLRGVSTTTTIVNGQPVVKSQVPYTGTYTVNSDCTGTEVDIDVNSIAFHYILNVGPNGNKEVFTEVDPGVIAGGVETRESGQGQQ